MEEAALKKEFGALIGERDDKNSPNDQGEMIINIDEDKIKKNIYQPRHRFNDESIDELRRSIKEKGVIQPIIVRRIEDGYELIAGERRLIAARKAGLKRIPALVKDITDKKDILEIALIENIQREDLNPIDRARSYRRLIDEFGENQETVARRVGKERSSIANTIRLLELPDKIREMVEEGRLKFGQARTLIPVKDKNRQLRLAKLAAGGRISVRKLEKMVERGRKKKASKKQPGGKEPHVQYAENTLREALKTKITIKRNRKGGGKIEIEYFSDSELTRLCASVVEETENK